MTELTRFISTCTILTLLAISGVIAVALIPDKWERRGWREAIVLRICPGAVPVVRLPNGEMWVRLTWSTRYRVDNEKTVCAPSGNRDDPIP
jgi:hypothetical protein